MPVHKPNIESWNNKLILEQLMIIMEDTQKDAIEDYNWQLEGLRKQVYTLDQYIPRMTDVENHILDYARTIMMKGHYINPNYLILTVGYLTPMIKKYLRD